MQSSKRVLMPVVLLLTLFFPTSALADSLFNPNFIISDAEMQDAGGMSRDEVQNFLDSKGSYLRLHKDIDVDGVTKPAADIIYHAAQTYSINPKFLLVTLQKEQSLVTDDQPTQKQLNWATGYAVCDSCSMEDPAIQKHKGFGNQVDNAAGIIRWYYDNEDKPFVKKKDVPIKIDSTDVTPQSWATAFLYTYTPHLHGNKNFWAIWETWFSQFYPDGTLVQPDDTNDVWIIQNGERHKFASKTALITRADPNMIVPISPTDLANYKVGSEITYPNYSILRTELGTYLLDNDTLRPFESDDTVKKLGFNPQEITEVSESDLSSYPRGEVITADSKGVQGIVYRITDSNSYYLLKDNKLFPLLDKKVADVNFKGLRVEKHKLADVKKMEVADLPIIFKDGTLLQTSGSIKTFVMEKGKKRPIADDDTFIAMGYKRTNVIKIDNLALAAIPQGDTLYLNSNLLSSKNKYLGDSESKVEDLFKTKIPAYLVAEYPSGRIISGKGIDTRRPIASLAKLLTAYEALNQNFDMNKVSTYNSKKQAAEGNVLQLVDGEKIKNKDLFNTMLIRSVNNTARMVAQATGISEDEFVSDITSRLGEWGADNTNLVEVTGLDAESKTTPRDLLKIFTKVLTNKTIKDTLSKTDYSFKEVVDKNKLASHTLHTTNQIIDIKNRGYRVLASKTGNTDEGGANLIMLIESKKTKKQYVIVTMGDKNSATRFTEPNKIAEWISTGNVKIASAQ